MAWEPSVTTETGIAEAGFTAWYALLPKEIAHVQVVREAGSGTTDDMLIDVFASVDNGTTIDTLHLRSFRIPPATPMPVFSFTVTGVRYFRMKMTAIGTTDTITATFNILRDGGLVVP